MKRLVVLAALGALLAAPAAHAQQASEHQEVNQAWVFIEAGNFTKAEATLKAAYADTRWGPVNAELLFALSAIFWEKRNAMASYQWLAEAAETRAERHYDWEPGDGWDARIDKRKRFLERNFGIVKLELVEGKSVPPLHDPPSRDPVVKAFADGIAARVAEADKAGQPALWLVIPKGTYWVGDQKATVEPGNLELAEAPSWRLKGDARAWATHRKRLEGPQDAFVPAGAPLGTGLRVALGAGGDLGTRTTRAGDVGGVGGGPSLSGEVSAEATVPATRLAIRVGVHVAMGSLPACPTAHSSTTDFGVHVGPRLDAALADRVWLVGAFGARVGGGAASRDASARAACAEASLAGDDDEIWAVAIAGEDGEAGVVTLGELGWQGGFFGVGPFGEIGLLTSPPGAKLRIGFAVQAAYDRVLPVLPEAREVRFRTASGIGEATVGRVAGNASFGRLTVGGRLVLLLGR